MVTGDTVTVLANASSEASGEWAQHIVEQSDLLKPLEFVYQTQKLKALRPGTIHLSYVVEKEDIRHVSRPISIELLALLPDPEPKYQVTDPLGNRYFLTIVENEGGELVAPVIQHFPVEAPQPGDRLMLIVHSRQPHSYAFPVDILSSIQTLELRIPDNVLGSLLGQTIHMATLWQRRDGTLVTSRGGDWIVANSGGKQTREPSRKLR